jgi:anti-sigma factor RsiW
MSGVHEHVVGLELQDLLDGTLAEPRRADVAQHVAACAQCRGQLAALTQARDAMRQLPDESAPPELRTRVLAGLDAIDREAQRPHGSPRTTRRVAAGLILAAAAALATFVVLRDSDSEPVVPPAQIAADYRAYEGGSIALGVRTADPAAVETYFRERGITFPTRVFDLGMMGYTVVGGTVHGPPDAERALFVYRAADGIELACQMYIGRVETLPPAVEVREHNGIAFHIYRAGDVTLVFWQEGEVICVLASDARPEAVVELAMAKAVRV